MNWTLPTENILKPWNKDGKKVIGHERNVILPLFYVIVISEAKYGENEVLTKLKWWDGKLTKLDWFPSGSGRLTDQSAVDDITHT